MRVLSKIAIALTLLVGGCHKRAAEVAPTSAACKNKFVDGKVYRDTVPPGSTGAAQLLFAAACNVNVRMIRPGQGLKEPGLIINSK